MAGYSLRLEYSDGMTKLCECGCGEPAPIAKMTNRKQGCVKGQPQRFIAGHSQRGRKMPPRTVDHQAKLSAAKVGLKYPPRTAEHQAKISAGIEGSANPKWKGDEASYGALHSYLNRKFPKTGTCDQCKEPKKTTYALIHGRTYSRDRKDYLELCYLCHRTYDKVSA
jgi:hypothetical protein